MLQHPLRADDPRAAPIGPGHIHLRPLRLDSFGGASGSFFALKDAKHSRAAAGHQGSDSAVLFQRGLDGLVVSGTTAFLQRVACGGTHTCQILGADRLFLGFAVGVGAAAHFVISGKASGVETP